jgi:hypothetical protein
VVAVSAPRRGRDRRHQFPGRSRSILLRCSDDEYQALKAAAARSGLTPSGFAAEAAIAAATGSEPPRADSWREALTEVMAARAQVRRYGNNINQAVRVLHVSGEAPEWLRSAVRTTDAAVDQLDDAARRLTRWLR